MDGIKDQLDNFCFENVHHNGKDMVLARLLDKDEVVLSVGLAVASKENSEEVAVCKALLNYYQKNKMKSVANKIRRYYLSGVISIAEISRRLDLSYGYVYAVADFYNIEKEYRKNKIKKLERKQNGFIRETEK